MISEDQAKDDLRTPVLELKDLLAPIRGIHLDGISRHINEKHNSQHELHRNSSATGDELVALRVRRGKRSDGSLSATAGHVRRHRPPS